MEELDHRILREVQQIPDLAVVVVFGSRAQGTHRPTSDLDVAVLPVAGQTRSRRKLQTRVAVALADLSPDGRVDVVFLDEAPPLLRQRIMEGGRLLLCRDDAAWRCWRVRTMREHGDRDWGRRLLRNAQRRRLTEGTRNGRSGRALSSLERVGRLSH